jgi:hypothetical protein
MVHVCSKVRPLQHIAATSRPHWPSSYLAGQLGIDSKAANGSLLSQVDVRALCLE